MRQFADRHNQLCFVATYRSSKRAKKAEEALQHLLNNMRENGHPHFDWKPEDVRMCLNGKRLLFVFATRFDDWMVEGIMRRHRPTLLQVCADYQQLVIRLETPTGVDTAEALAVLGTLDDEEKNAVNWLLRTAGPPKPTQRRGKHGLEWKYDGEGIYYPNLRRGPVTYPDILYAPLRLDLSKHESWKVTIIPFEEGKP